MANRQMSAAHDLSKTTPKSRADFRNIIHAHVGQFGVQAGEALWDTYCTELGIGMDGYLKGPTEDDSHLSLFSETCHGKHIPRCLYVDLEGFPCDTLMNSRFKDLFSRRANFSLADEGGCNNFARARFTVGKTLIKDTTNKLRILAELASPCGFIRMSSLEGGTGSGYTVLMAEDYPFSSANCSTISVDLHLCRRQATATTGPYNMMLHLNGIQNRFEMSMIFDNESLYSTLENRAKLTDITYADTNYVIAQTISALTATTRMHGDCPMDLHSFKTNLIPFPSIGCVTTGLGALASKGSALTHCTRKLTMEAFRSYSNLHYADPNRGVNMSVALIYRGPCNGSLVNTACIDIQSKLKFVSWCPTGFKTAILSEPEVYPEACGKLLSQDRNLVRFSNNTSVGMCFKKICNQFDRLYEQRCFVVWYISEGMEEGEFMDARETMSVQCDNYRMLTQESVRPRKDENE